MSYEITAETARRAATIQGLEIQVPTPFNEGHVLTVNEAAAMNQLFIENIRNNNARHVQAAEKDETRGAMEAAELQVLVDDYATSYEFGVRSVGGTRVVRDPVENRTRKIGLAKLDAALKAKGFTRKAVTTKFGPEKVEEYLAQILATNPAIAKEAARQIKAERAAADSEADVSLDDLGEPDAEPAAEE